jgi:hypothetical protein
MIGCHENDSSLLRSNSIKSIKKSWKSYFFSFRIDIYTFSFNKEAIDVFKENDTLSWASIKSPIKTIIIKSVTAEV